MHVISPLDYSDVYFTLTKGSRSGLTAFEAIIINSAKPHTPGREAESGQIIQALKVTLVMFPSFSKPVYIVVILTI